MLTSKDGIITRVVSPVISRPSRNMTAHIRGARDAKGMMKPVAERTGIDYERSAYDPKAYGVVSDK